MTPRKRPTRSQVRSLERIILRVERWQNRQDAEHLDEQSAYDVGKAKSLLMETLSRLEGG